MRKICSSANWLPKRFGGVLATVISVVAFSLTSHASRLVLGWNPNPTNEDVTAYLVTLKTNGTSEAHVWTNIWVDQLVTETNVVPVYHAERRWVPPVEAGPIALGGGWEIDTDTLEITGYTTNVTQRLPLCAVITNPPPEHVYWITVCASNVFGLSPPGGPLLHFASQLEEQVGMATTFSNGFMHCEAPVIAGWSYWLKSSHGTPGGSFDPCCGDFVTNRSTVHWNQLFDGDYLGLSPLTGIMRFQIRRDPQRDAQMFKLYRAITPNALTNATINPTVNYP